MTSIDCPPRDPEMRDLGSPAAPSKTVAATRFWRHQRQFSSASLGTGPRRDKAWSGRKWLQTCNGLVSCPVIVSLSGVFGRPLSVAGIAERSGAAE